MRYLNLIVFSFATFLIMTPAPSSAQGFSIDIGKGGVSLGVGHGGYHHGYRGHRQRVYAQPVCHYDAWGRMFCQQPQVYYPPHPRVYYHKKFKNKQRKHRRHRR